MLPAGYLTAGEIPMDDADLAIDVSDDLYAAFVRQAEANRRTPDDEARAILIATLPPKTGQTSDTDGSG